MSEPKREHYTSSGDFFYAILLFAIAAAAIGWQLSDHGSLLTAGEPFVALFFLAYGLFTIAVGFPHPSFGHVSFDRVAQVSSILVLGPVDAAWINGLASLIYPWHRLWLGIPVRPVIVASLVNAGLMGSMVLIGGLIYTAVAGPVPLMDLESRSLVAVGAMVIAMQVYNDAGMGLLLKLRGKQAREVFNWLAFAVEVTSAIIGVLVALVFNRLELTVLVMLLIVLSLGMLLLRQFANIKLRLEQLVRDRTQALREQTRTLERLATHDELTGLYNRRFADEYLDRELDRFNRHRNAFCVALADIDFFKDVNDRHSHAVGDEVLQRVADILRQRCRADDILARYGGEEFVLCFPETDLGAAVELCNALRRAVEDADWGGILDSRGITLSFGLAPAKPGIRRANLLAEADANLYQAKYNGRNQVVA